MSIYPQLEDFPKTLKEFEDLYQRIVHACKAGLHQEAFDNDYWCAFLNGHRIDYVEHFSPTNVAALTEVNALSCFFDLVWQRPSNLLCESARSFVLVAAGLRLWSLKRLAEGVEAFSAAMKEYIDRDNWRDAALAANYLWEIYSESGDQTTAIMYEQQAKELAERSNNDYLIAIIGKPAWYDGDPSPGSISYFMPVSKYGDLLAMYRKERVMHFYEMEARSIIDNDNRNF
jgi:tetratricopeptide (TPR) repeat protein